MRVLGIDPGLSGGLALVEDGKLVECCIAPTIDFTVAKRRKQKDGSTTPFEGLKREYNEDELVRIIERLKPDHVFLERSQSMPGQGVSSMFSIGLGYGTYRGILAALRLPRTLVHPKTWQKTMFQDLPKTDTKAMSHIVCIRLWPGQVWTTSPRCKKAHDGMTDAAMIAAYGCRTLTGITGVPHVQPRRKAQRRAVASGGGIPSECSPSTGAASGDGPLPG